MQHLDRSLVFKRQKGGQSAKNSGQVGYMSSVITEEGQECLGTLNGQMDGGLDVKCQEKQRILRF